MAKNLYHLSFSDSLPNTLYPRQPHGTGTKEDGSMLEELPARVSFSPSIQQCFSAIYPNISHVFEKINDGKGYPYIIMYLYVPVLDGTEEQIPERDVRKAVWDSHVTGEVCFSSPVKVRLAGKIKIINPYRAPGGVKDITTKPFNRASSDEMFVSPEIKFSLAEKYGERVSIL